MGANASRIDPVGFPGECCCLETGVHWRSFAVGLLDWWEGFLEIP
jgi:hypothetical protein